MSAGVVIAVFLIIGLLVGLGVGLWFLFKSPSEETPKEEKPKEETPKEEKPKDDKPITYKKILDKKILGKENVLKNYRNTPKADCETKCSADTGCKGYMASKNKDTAYSCVTLKNVSDNLYTSSKSFDLYAKN